MPQRHAQPELARAHPDTLSNYPIITTLIIIVSNRDPVTTNYRLALVVVSRPVRYLARCQHSDGCVDTASLACCRVFWLTCVLCVICVDMRYLYFLVGQGAMDLGAGSVMSLHVLFSV